MMSRWILGKIEGIEVVIPRKVHGLGITYRGVRSKNENEKSQDSPGILCDGEWYGVRKEKRGKNHQSRHAQTAQLRSKAKGSSYITGHRSHVENLT